MNPKTETVLEIKGPGISIVVSVKQHVHNGGDRSSGDHTKSVGNQSYPNDSVQGNPNPITKNFPIKGGRQNEGDPKTVMVYCEFCGRHNHDGLWRIPTAAAPLWMCEDCYKTRYAPRDGASPGPRFVAIDQCPADSRGSVR